MMTPERIEGSDPTAGHIDDITLEPMRRRHLGAVSQIEAHALHRPWSLATFIRELSHASERTYLIARKGGRIVGYGGVMYVLDEGHITTISVAPEHQREGIGTRLLLALLLAAIDKGMVSSSLEVRSSNEAAIEMYRRFGYAPAGIRPNYYAEVGEDAVVMWAHDINGGPYRRQLSAIAAASGLHGLEGVAVADNEPGADDLAAIAEAKTVTSLSHTSTGITSITDLNDPPNRRSTDPSTGEHP